MKHLYQQLNTKDDSFSYTVNGESEPTYIVDSNANLIHKGNHIGRFKLGDEQWSLYIDGVLFMTSGPNSLFKLPEFELKSLTALINRG